MESTPGPGGPSPSADPNDGDPSATTAYRRLRALRRLLRRLGLLDVLGRDWARVDAETKRITFGDVPEAEARAMLGETAASVYRFDPDVLATHAARVGPRPGEI